MSLEHITEDVSYARPQVSSGRAIHLNASEELTMQTVVRRRTDIKTGIKDGQGDVSLYFYGKTINMPGNVQPAIHFILEAGEFAPEALPGEIDDSGKLTLTRRLLKEGLLTTQ